MKTTLALFLAIMLLCSYTAVAAAQELPKEILDAAQSQFELAYKAEYGALPPAKTTAEAMQEYTDKVNELATRLGARAGQKAKRLQDMRVAYDKLDGPALIGSLAELRPSTLVGFGFSKSRVAELVAPGIPVNQFEGVLLAKDPSSIVELKENSEVVFPAGTYTLDEQKLTRHLRTVGKGFPKGVAFVGSGKDKTTLKITDAGFTRFDVDRLSFRDMTIDCDNDGLFDKRQGSLTLQLSGVRLVRFDAGHGGCDLFSINDGLIVHAADCEFAGGHGRSPGHGSIFDSVDVFLGYFERCSFSGIDYDLFRSLREPNSSLWMDECKFDRKYRANNSVHLSECEFDFNPPALDWVPED